MQINLNSKQTFTTTRVVYHFTIGDTDYEYTEHEDERGKVIDSELFTANGLYVEDEEIQDAIEEFLDTNDIN